ncbi:uncharacterized protein LOC144473636 isoform X2 [Augochlora pura]
MNYNGNMPDWHQFNASQTNEVTAPTQNVNSGHLTFIPGVSPPTLNALSLSSDGLNKHQNDTNFNPRNYQSYNNVSNGTNISNNSPLVSMAQMQNCISHYTSQNTRNPMLDNLNSSVDPRNTAIANINDDLGYRSNQVPFNGPMSLLNGPSCNLNTSGPISGLGSRTNSGVSSGTGNGPAASPIYGSGPRHGSVSGFASESGSGPTNMGPRNTNINSVHAGKPGPPSYVPCKGLCCNSDPNINYQQFGSYQSNAPYRDNVHPPNYQMENRHFGNNCNFRKDNLVGKEAMGSVVPNASVVDHRRNFTDYKYHKDHLLHRNYSTSSGMFPNYPMQNYNYSTEHQKYPYPMKEHPKTNNMNIPNSAMMKHSEQNYMPQQKYNNKQYQYQNGNMLPKAVPTLNIAENVVTSPQNAYYNSQFARNIPTEISHECQESVDNNAIANRLAGTFVQNPPPQNQTYQHKIAMQKFSMENHLRELSRIPGYQSHPKYKECIMRYRQLVKLQQSANYQNSIQTSRVATPVNTSIPPINLQFDQNGMLINSNYLSDGIPKLPHAPPGEQSSDAMEKQIKDQAISVANEKRQQTQQPEHLIMPTQNENIPSSSIGNFQKRNQFLMQKDFNQNQLKVQTSDSHSFNTLNTNDNNKTMMQQKVSKEFANKPELDVRQFLANWDETDDEESTSNLPATDSNKTTPVVVVSYENVALSSETPQNLQISRRNSYPSSDTTVNNGKEAEENVVTQDCLTIYSSTEATADIINTSKRTIEEGVVKPGSIIHCISNGPDEIPTIHIVDNLEISNILGASNDQVIETLEKQSTIPLFRDTANKKSEGIVLETTEQHDENETRLLSTKYDDVVKDSNVRDTTISETIQTVTVSINNQELRVLSPSVKSNLDVTDNLELKKQNSFASEESHNPDDISLPDLPTSECTPISTTLNTPIHSDSEESSQNMEDLSISISTNPIEVMQNSPVISFTQSPINMDPYGQLNDEDKISYKNNINSTHEQNTTINNFDFSANNPKVKSAELSKDKQVKNLGIIRKKLFLTEDKEHEIRVLDTCETLTSTAYELEVQQKTIHSEKNTEYESLSCIHEGKPKKKTKLMDSVKSAIQTSNSVMDTNKAVHTVISNDSNINFINPTEFDNEAQSSKHEEDLSKQQKIKNLNTSVTTINPLFSEGDLDSRKMIKESVNCVDKCIDRNTNCENLMQAQKKEVQHLIQSKHSDVKRTVRDGLNLSQDDEQSVCHMTSQYKNSIAVIKDTIILSDKKSRGTAGIGMNICCDNPHELQLKADGTKELSVETKMKKSSQNSKKSEIVQKDLDVADEDIRCTTGEAHSLNECNRNKDKLHQDKNVEERLQKEDDIIDRGISLEQNVSSLVNPGSDDLTASEDSSRLKFRKSFVKNANPEFGIQVTNVNLKFKDNDLGKELILGEKGQDHMKDTLESIKIEINVSCAERNLQGHDHNKRFLYEIDDSSRSNMENHCRTHSTEQEVVYDNFDKVNKIIEKSSMIGDITLNEKSKITNDAATSVMDTNTSTAHRNSRRGSMEVRDDTFSLITFKDTLTSENQTVTKLLQDNLTCKDTQNVNVKENINCSFNVDMTKTKSAISNTAIDDANSKMFTKKKDKFEEQDGTVNTEDDHIVSFAENSSRTTIEAFKKSDEAKLDDLSHMLKDFDLNKLEYKKGIGVKTGELNDNYMGMWKKPKIDHIFEDCDMFQSTSGYINPIFSNIDKMEDLHTVPVYTTKDGKISYSPNRRCTHHELMTEARRRETGCSTRKSHYGDSWNNYYNSKFRKFYKKKRHHGCSDQNKYEYKDTKYLYQRKRDLMDDFCGKHHFKYKDYIHSIKNNNAVWSDRFRIERVCSSSDSDEVVGHNENTINVNELKMSNIIENKTVAGVSKSHKHEMIAESENKHKESVTFDACSCKTDGTVLKETQLMQHNFLDINECIETVNDKGNINSDITNNEFINTEIKENIKSNCISKNLQRDKNDKPSGECVNTEIDETDNTNINNDVRAERNIKDDEVYLLNKNDQLLNSFIFKEKENNEVYTLQSTVDIKEQQLENVMNEKNHQSPVLKCQDTFKNHTETSVILETKRNENSTCETDTTEHHVSTEMSENILPSEVTKETSTEIIIVSPKNGSKEINDEMLVDNKTDFDQNMELVETLNTNEKHVEDTNENAEESIISLEDERDDSRNDISEESNVICTKQEEYESHITQMFTLNNPQSSKNSVEIVKNNEAVNTDLTQVDNLITKQCIELTDFSETAIHVNEDYTINKSVTSPKKAMDVTLPNVKDMLTENAIISFNNSEEHSDTSYPDKLQNENETVLIRESFVENEILHLRMYNTTMNSPSKTCMEKKSYREEYGQKEEERQLTAFNSSSNLETDSFQSSMDVKIIPKLVIKKTDALISKTEYLLDSTQLENPSDKYNTKLLPDLRPKIPKMIIMKSKSRSTTPIAEMLEKNKFETLQSSFSEHNDTSVDVDNSDSESYTLKYKNYESKVPKVKIKLDNISSKDLKIYMKRKATKKNVSEMNVKRIKIQENKYSPTNIETEESSEAEASDEEQILEEFITNETDKIPKLKSKKQDEDKTLSLERIKENDTNVSKTVLKKAKKIKEEDVKQFNNDEIRKKYPQYITEKIPKVIIKRTQIGTEFKCEISKSKKCSNIDAPKWQPKVKLERLKILDNIAKDIKQPGPLLNDKLRVADDINDKNSDLNSKVKLCRSNSASNLSPIKSKQRRFSNPDYTKIKSADFTDIDLKHKSKSLNASEASNFKVMDSENKNLKRKGSNKSLSSTKSMNHSYNNESDSDIDIEESSENHLTKDENDLLVEKREFSSFETNANISSVEDKYLPSGILDSRNFDDNENSIIKVDSSDESQTTIELLPASPDSSDNESKNREFESTPRLRLDDAIPTQLELELDLIDLRNAQHLDVLAPKINMLNYVNIDKYEHASHSKNICVNTGLAKTFLNDFQCSSQSAFSKNKVQSPKKESNDYFYCNDLLVKEVLAAKETLKKCLSQSVNEDKEKCVLRPKTVAEKKQGLGFNLKTLTTSYYKSENTKCTDTLKKEYKSIQQMDIEKAEENHSKQDEHSSMEQQIKLKESQEETSYDCPTASTCRYTSVPESTTISLKATKKLGQITINKKPSTIETDTFNISNNLDTIHDTPKLTEEKLEKKTTNNIQDKKDDNSSETKTKEDNMPLLVPEFVLNYDSNSDRDSSRSPPVITNQEESDNAVENTKGIQNKVISPIDKVEENSKHSYKDCEMTIADIITQLAYHEKATIKHRRYCNLCERWFPTTSRHLRHLAGYQHRYMELTQRKSIHTLFILFTGKPCPRLLPANVIRNDCSIGELTPLQIAVQDVANYVEPTEDVKMIE